MHEPPSNVHDADVLDVVRQHWLPEVDRVKHLPVGFGAHHWAAYADETPQLFVTLDTLGNRHTAETLTAAYRSAARLADRGLEFVLAPVPPLTVPVGDRVASVTPWREGAVLDTIDPVTTAQILNRLHREAAPPGIPTWQPLVPSDFAEDLRARVASPWVTGPFGERARAALKASAGNVATWTTRYYELAAQARTRTWVVTHGEPHERNQLVAADGVLLIDWESVKLAPAERDLRTLVDAGRADLADISCAMVEMFDLEWRLDEISQYSAWFASPHDGTASDETAFAGMLDELNRPDWERP